MFGNMLSNTTIIQKVVVIQEIIIQRTLGGYSIELNWDFGCY